jgi:uncharacterized membrane protein YfcA
MEPLLTSDGAAWLAVLAIVLVSGLVHGALGLGFPLLATPALATMMDVRSAILVTLLPTMAVNLASIAGNRGGIARARSYGPMLVFVLLGSIMGTAALAAFDPSPFRLLLAALILLYLRGGLRVSRSRLQQHRLSFMALFGLLAGLAAGTTNVMVAVLLIYFLSLQTPRLVMVPTLNACFLAGKASQVIVLSLAGYVTGHLLLVTTPLALAAVGALLVGQRLHSRFRSETYHQLMRWLLLLLALILIGQYLLQT